MQSVKIACTRCSQHRQCPNKTRLFVNYCGAAPKKMNENIRGAILECRLRKGFLFKRDFTLHVSASSILAATPS
ncbi:MAG: hypothetical protein ABSF80_04845 [Chitinispirillaceae bacterium]